jgi:hypothetical protein
MLKKLILLTILLVLSACGRINIYKYKAHDYKDAGDAKVSILHVTRENYVYEIDGKGKYSPDHVSDLFPYSAAQIELLPGTHTLSLKFASSIYHSVNKNDLTFNFLPGRQYFLHSSIVLKKTGTNDNQLSVLYQIDECGTKQETDYNESAKKEDRWLAPYVPACGK